METMEEVRHIGSKIHFHSFKLNGHDIRKQNDTRFSVTFTGEPAYNETLGVKKIYSYRRSSLSKTKVAKTHNY